VGNLKFRVANLELPSKIGATHVIGETIYFGRIKSRIDVFLLLVLHFNCVIIFNPQKQRRAIKLFMNILCSKVCIL